MIVGIPKEIKNQEYRVGALPLIVRELTDGGHEVLVETQAGVGIGVSDEDYKAVGAQIVSTADEVFERANLIVKVKEPQPEECHMLRQDQVLFTYLHLAPDPKQAELLQESGCVAIAYETVTDNQGRLPLLAPMSEVAGRFSVQAGAYHLEKAQGGRGVLLGGVPGVKPANVVVIGGGVVGVNALRIAIGMGANVTVLDNSAEKLRILDAHFGNSLDTVFSTRETIEQALSDADLVIGAVLVAGAAAPKLITREDLKHMPNGSVLVDVAVDQGGCAESTRPTTHDDPIYVEEGVIHYCVANMPGAVARTSTWALNHATLPFILDLANKGYQKACLDDPHLMNGMNVHAGHITHEAVAKALGQPFTDPKSVL